MKTDSKILLNQQALTYSLPITVYTVYSANFDKFSSQIPHPFSRFILDLVVRNVLHAAVEVVVVSLAHCVTAGSDQLPKFTA